MRQAQKKKEKDKIAIVLILCFSVMALTSIFIIKANIDKINQNTPNLPVSEEARTSERTDDVQPQKEASVKVPTIDSINNDSSKNTVPENEDAVIGEFLFPVKDENAKVTNPYSMNKLIYSVTLDQYMTHSGVDIEAAEDSQVLAIAEGTVTSIYNDDRYGTSIEITHTGNLISIYSNLSTAEMVEVGDVVSRGQIIGGVGSTGLFESLEPSHLHLEIIKDGTYVDPKSYINF